MKNIHILPTVQPSRLVKIKDTFFITSSVDIPGGTFYNIHITNDEEIGEGDWYLDTTVNVIFKNDKLFLNGTGYKKIILSTDPTLIADGVQAIDDDFLKWFIKNPSCDFIEVKEKSPNEIEKELGIYGHDIGLTENEYSEWLKNGGQLYKIIIPQEEPKPDLEKEMFQLEQELDIPSSMRWHNSKPKQETLEEAAYRLSAEKFEPKHTVFMLGVIEGAKWKAERMYNEEDLREAFKQSRQCKIFEKDMPPVYNEFEEWFEEFKKK